MASSNPELPVQSGAVDTHCHLFLMDQEPAVVVEAARAVGITLGLMFGPVVVGDDVRDGIRFWQKVGGSEFQLARLT